MEHKQKRKYIFLKFIGAVLALSLLGFYAYCFPVTMELLDGKVNEIISFAGGDFSVSVFSDFSVFVRKTVENARYYYEIIKGNLENEFFDTSPLPVAILSCAAEFPVENGKITSEFGKREDPFSGKTDSHSGMDIAAAFGSSIFSAWPGEITETGFDEIYGKYVVVEHSEGFFTKYCHLSKVCASEGDFASAGEKIGEAGSTGRSTGSHLHFEVEIGGRKIDPMECFEF